MYVSMYGNCGMATGGSGDVLAGIITSLLAQGVSRGNAAILGVYIHAVTGDIALQKQSIHSLLPSDIIENLCETFLNIKPSSAPKIVEHPTPAAVSKTSFIYSPSY